MAEFSYSTGWTDIANQALKSLTANLINSMLDGSPNATFCRQFMGSAIERVLTDTEYRCATKRAVLNRLTETPAYGPAYYYQLPTDYIRFATQDDGKEGIDTGGAGFSVEEGGKVATDGETVQVLYIARPSDPAKLAPYVREEISAQLAVKLSIPLNSSETTAARVLTEYKMARDAARDGEAKARRNKSVTEDQGFIWYDENR